MNTDLFERQPLPQRADEPRDLEVALGGLWLVVLVLQATQVLKELGKVQVDLAQVVAWDVRYDNEESVSQMYTCAQ